MDQPVSLSSPGIQQMHYLPAIRAAATDPRQLEELYQSSRAARAAGQFAMDMHRAYEETPENVLFAAWHYRLEHERQSAPHAYLSQHWRLAVTLSAALALAYWLLSDPRYVIAGVPVLAVVWSPLAAVALMAFLVVTSRRGVLRAIALGLGLIALTAYGIALTHAAATSAPQTGGPGPQSPQQTYIMLMALHLPLLSAAAVALTLLGLRSTAEDRFAFLTKAYETIGTAGIASIVGGIFVGLTIGIFQALNITLADGIVRLLVLGGAGLIPVLAVATIYDPALPPTEQDFRRGLGTLLTTLLRALLPLSIVVLVAYVAVIPANFAQPFTNRDTLIVYNALLFAILGLLVGVTPVRADDVSGRLLRWLRAGILALAVLVVLISLYALAATLYRTSQGQLTMNRLTILGWNVINIAVLATVLVWQARSREGGWLRGMQMAFSVGMLLYVVWAAFVVLALPWLFA